MAVTWSQLSTYRWQQLAAQTWAAPIPGQPFLPAVLGGAGMGLLEFAFGADLTADPSTWAMTDVTDDLRHNPGVTISRGRPDEASQCQPATMTFVLTNSSGDYTARRAMSQYYPYMRQDLPVRFSIDPGTGRKERFAGFVASITPGWDISGKSPTAIVTITAAGILRRLGQGITPVKSPLDQYIGDLTDVSAWWPMEDGPFASSVASAVTDVPDMTIAGGVTTGAAGPLGSRSAVSYDATGQLEVRLPAVAGITGWRVLCILNPTGASPIQIFPLLLKDSAGNNWAVYLQQSGTFDILVAPVDTTGAGSGPSTTTFNLLDGNWHIIGVEFQQNGADIDLHVVVDGFFADHTAAFTSRTLGSLVGAWVNPQFTNSSGVLGAPDVGAISHLFVEQPYSGVHYSELLSPAQAWDGEQAVDRLTRLCDTEGVPLTTVGFLGESMPMGVQPVGTFFQLIRQCEATEGGVLSDGTNFGLSYEMRSHRYNQAVKLPLDIAAGGVADPFAPVDDDARIRNDIAVTATADLSGSTPDGSSVHVSDIDSIAAHGKYDTSISVNTATDGSVDLTSIATWQLHLGTLDVTRYPSLGLNLAAAPSQVANWLSVVEGSRMTVTNLPTEASDGDVDNIIEGYTEKITVVDWDVTMNCSPAVAYDIGVVDDATHGIVGSDGLSTLNADISDSALSWSVDVVGAWTTDAGDFPMDIDIGGEQITLSGIGAVSGGKQTFTASARSVNGVVKGHHAGDPVEAWKIAVIALSAFTSAG